MKIGLDARSMSNRICGVSRVTNCLISALSMVDIHNEYIVYTDNIVPNFDIGKNFKVVPTYCSRMSPVADLKFFNMLKRDNISMYHSMHSWLPWFVPRNIKTIVTIHDLFALTDPDFFKKYKPFQGMVRVYFAHAIAQSLRRADTIITVSNYSGMEIAKLFPFCEKKMEVVYNACGIDVEKISKQNEQKGIMQGKYVLYVGNCRSYKNVDTLIKGFSIFLETCRNADIRLIIAGNDDYAGVIETTKELNINNDVIFLTNPSDDEIANLYSHACAFIFPSKYEGFGIPVLEAMQFGVPVIISDAEALTEVAGDAAIVFKRNSPAELATLIERVLGDKMLREFLVDKGYERAKKFSWELSARNLIDIYQNISNNGDNK